MFYPLLIIILVIGCFVFLSLLHARNYKFAEVQSQDCKEAGGIPEVRNTWGGLGFAITCKTKDVT
ncbi:hypothetical protein D8Z77_22350 [Brevibacillus laterosporus]|nr:hypothetical protein D8Z77_22350 [Brevibacillus laterosporus]